MRPPRRVRVFVWGIVAVACAGTVLIGVRADLSPPANGVLASALLALVIGLSRLFPVQLGPRAQVAVDTAPAFAAVLLLPPSLAVAATALGLTAAGFVRPTIFLQQAFNISVGVLAVAAGSGLTAVLLPVPIDEASNLQVVRAAIPAALAMWATNAVLVDAVIALQQRRRLFERWWAVNRRGIWQVVSLYLLGLLLVVSPA